MRVSFGSLGYPSSSRVELGGLCRLRRLGTRFRSMSASVLALALMLGSGNAGAAGFDTPILYTARHQGMGGAAISYVDDPSAAFHNPAGLQGVNGLAFLGDVSMLLAHVTGSPASTASASGIQSQLIVAPLFLAAAAYRVQPWLTLGLGIFPSASGGAEYQYAMPDSEAYQVNATTLVFYEVTPLLSLNVPRDMLLPGQLSFGVGYRATLTTFERQQGERENPRGLDLDLSGSNFTGFRAGMQYRAGELFTLGVMYRNKIDVNTRADEATVLGMPATDVELPFILPAQFGAGIRSDYDRLGVAFDAVYTFQSQNERTLLTGSVGGNVASIPNVFAWRDAFTLRFGFEFRLGPSEELPIRVGYVYDETVSSRTYPSAFATPPAPTRTFTLGGGYDTGSWEVNVALALRGGSTRIDAAELAPASSCPTCGFSGEYAITTTGLYLDFSTDIEL
jgi:long-chain fatty acid transport protein